MGFFSRIKSDIVYLDGLRRTLKAVEGISPDSDNLLPDDYERSVDAHGSSVVFRFEGASTTYAELDRMANRFANWGLAQGLKAGDAVALFMENKPDYVAAWYGLSKIGVVTALINSNLQSAAMAHCVKVADAKALIVDAALAELYDTARAHLPAEIGVWAHGGGGNHRVAEAQDLDAALAAASDARPDRSHRAGIKAGAVALYIYTSGTTGLPKAARMTHARTQGMQKAFIAPCRVTEKDRVYVALPLYHGTGGMCGVGATIYSGATCVLRRKFSASAFWDEAIAEKATVFVYIGELCRYLMNQPPSGKERQHSFRTCFGNGLRPDVWDKFVARTGIRNIVEFYGSTEGTVSFVNLDGKAGAVGRIPPMLKDKIPAKILKFDIESEQPVRGPDGLCIEAADGEVGEAVGAIDPSISRQRFEGYNDKAQTEKKILRDVFARGDMYFRTGDLMKKDKDGYFYFIDRIGDTFRWKGENVSTNEVAEVVSGCPGVAFANVYGVQIGDLDGRAGMAALVLEDGFDLARLYAYLERELPAYARPYFIRIQPEADTTGTFKYRKVDLVAQGFDPAKTTDRLYFANPATGAFEPVDADLHARLQAGEIKL